MYIHYYPIYASLLILKASKLKTLHGLPKYHAPSELRLPSLIQRSALMMLLCAFNIPNDEQDQKEKKSEYNYGILVDTMVPSRFL